MNNISGLQKLCSSICTPMNGMQMTVVPLSQFQCRTINVDSPSTEFTIEGASLTSNNSIKDVLQLLNKQSLQTQHDADTSVSIRIPEPRLPQEQSYDESFFDSSDSQSQNGGNYEDNSHDLTASTANEHVDDRSTIELLRPYYRLQSDKSDHVSSASSTSSSRCAESELYDPPATFDSFTSHFSGLSSGRRSGDKLCTPNLEEMPLTSSCVVKNQLRDGSLEEEEKQNSLPDFASQVSLYPSLHPRDDDCKIKQEDNHSSTAVSQLTFPSHYSHDSFADLHDDFNLFAASDTGLKEEEEEAEEEEDVDSVSCVSESTALCGGSNSDEQQQAISDSSNESIFLMPLLLTQEFHVYRSMISEHPADRQVYESQREGEDPRVPKRRNNVITQNTSIPRLQKHSSPSSSHLVVQLRRNISTLKHKRWNAKRKLERIDAELRDTMDKMKRREQGA